MATRPRVYTAADAACDAGTSEDSYLTKVVKYIPAEIVAAYVAAARALEGAGGQVDLETALWVVATVLLALTPLWIIFAASEPGKPRPAFQAAAAAFAFACWVFALGGPFEFLAWYRPVYGTLILIFATLALPVVEKALVRPPAPAR
ncbi:MAG: hypothetical protein WAW06_09055 [bacterium]